MLGNCMKSLRIVSEDRFKLNGWHEWSNINEVSGKNISKESKRSDRKSAVLKCGLETLRC